MSCSRMSSFGTCVTHLRNTKASHGHVQRKISRVVEEMVTGVSALLGEDDEQTHEKERATQPI